MTQIVQHGSWIPSEDSFRIANARIKFHLVKHMIIDIGAYIALISS